MRAFASEFPVDASRGFCFLAGLLFLSLLPVLGAVPGGRDFGRTVPDVRGLEEGEAAAVLERFRSARGGPDAVLEGRLLQFPRRGEQTERDLWIRSRWEQGRLLLRIDFRPAPDAPSPRFLFEGGPDPRGWTYADGAAMELSGDAFLAPLVPGMEISAFDLAAPFLDWPQAVYEGSERVAGSPAHWFRFEPPAPWTERLRDRGIAAVRVALDTRFDAPIRAEYLGPDGAVVRFVEARSFQKFSETWIVRRLEAFDENTRDRTELRVDDALVEVRLPDEVFRPEGLSAGYASGWEPK